MAVDAVTRVLLVEDDEEDYLITRDLLRGIEGGAHRLEWVDSFDKGLEQALAERHDVCLVDYRLDRRTGLDLIRLARERGVKTPFILLTGLGDRETDLEAMSAGASDYLVKGRTDSALLDRSIRYAIDQARAIAVLARKTEELARSNRELEQFASVVSHDLKSPLHVVTSSLELFTIRNGAALGPDALRSIDRTLAAVMRMHALIDDLLAYARLNAVVNFSENVSCNDLFGAVSEDLGPTIAALGATVTRDDLPVVRGNATLLLQVFHNLVGNALKFHREQPHVHVGAETGSREWLFSVRDDGIGIPADQTETIFGMFKRLHARDEYPGTGIGLALCRKIVEMHGGRIWVESTPGQGSCFRFTIKGVRDTGK